MTPAVADLLPLAASVLARATVLLAGALLLSVPLARAAARARHAFWTMTAVILLALPWLSAVLPTLPLPMLPWPSSGHEVSQALRVAAPQAATTLVPIERRVAKGAPTRIVEGDDAVRAVASAPAPWRPLSALPSLLLLLWVTGTIGVAGSLMLGMVRVRRMVGRARALLHEPWSLDLDRSSRRVGMRRRVALHASADSSTAVAGGVLRPFVLLPESASRWSAERRELVLLHELVHLTRHDPLRHVIARCALALYWFHPLARVAARRAVLAREQACDEAVLALGLKPSVYARHLLELADATTASSLAPAFTERDQLEKRLMAILEIRRPGRTGSTAAAVLCAVLWGVTVAAAAPTAEAEEPRSPSVQQVPQAPPPPAPGVQQPPPPDDPPPPPAPSELPSRQAPPPPPPPRRPPEAQPVSCWVESAGFVGASARFLRSDSTGVEEHIGFVAGDRVLQSWLNDMSVCLRVHGDVTVRANGTLGPMPADGWLFLASRSSAGERELRISPDENGVRYSWWVDGLPRPLDPEGEAWRDAVLDVAADYWLLFDRVHAAGQEIARIAQELEDIGSARETARVRAVAAEAEARGAAEAAYRTLVEEYYRRLSAGQPHPAPFSMEAAIVELTLGGLGQTATITQDVSTLTITRSSSVGEFRGVYNLDGSETRNTLRVADQTVELVSRAKWVGSHLVITTGLDLGGRALEATMSLSLDPSGTLVVASASLLRNGGEPAMTTRLYRKS